MWTTTDARRPPLAYRPPMTDERRSEPRPGPILLCAGSEPAAAAGLAEIAAALLAARPVVVLATWVPPPVTGGFDAVMDALYDTHADLRELARGAAADAARAACDALRTHGLEARTRVCAADGAVWQTILDVADEVEAAVVVAGTAERSAPHSGSLGREARALAHRSRRPLLLAPIDAAPAAPDAPALLAYDGSVPAGHAIDAAVALLRPRRGIVASAWQSTSYALGLALLAVPEAIAHEGADELDETLRRSAEGLANEAAARLAAAGWPSDAVALENRSAAAAVVAAAAGDDAGIVVTGTRGRSRVAAALLGSTAEAILRHADRPVLLVPPAAD
jgi:nucleotide-binding universal stress UspA family protein